MSDPHRPLAFESTDSGDLEIVDRVERLRYRLRTDDAVTPAPVGEEPFLFPVDRAVEITTKTIVLPEPVNVYIRDDCGDVVRQVGSLDSASLGSGVYSIELNGQIQTYLRTESSLDVSANLFEMRIDFDGPTTVQVGAVSWHDRPAATVTTTDDPVAMMQAISTFGSALKTTTPERSYPSNRGHPPAVEVGDRIEIPKSVQPPDTGIELELPPTYKAVYAAAPLAYYLGATLVPGQQPRLVTADGFEYSLAVQGDLQRGIERTLKQLFVLDCVTRTEGIYGIELHERTTLDETVDYDWEWLYDQPLSRQVREYLRTPYATVRPHVPEWRLTVHIEQMKTAIEQLPYVVDNLAVVRTENYTQGQQPTNTARTDGGVLTRSTADAGSTDRSYVQPRSNGSMEQAWIGEGVPVGASKLTYDAFQNRLERSRSEGDIAITVVVNDTRMDRERDLVSQVYGDRSDLPFDVTFHRNLTVDGLCELLKTDTEFLHYIGHADDEGFECSDGKLDIGTLSETGVESFLLNACDSYRQGLDLITAGAIGGIVTLNRIPNDRAVDIGETLARLLNTGFPLRAALSVAREQSTLGGQYIVVGDGGLTVTQAPSRTPNLLEIERNGDQFEVTIETYTTDEAGIGSVYMPHIADNERYFLSSGSISQFSVDRRELEQFLLLENVPVRGEDTLYWSQSVDIDQF